MTSPGADFDPFALLAMPQRFDLDPADLRRAWLTRCAQSHPDRLAPGADAVREMARLNAAHETLADPERRAGALLALLGGPTKERNKTLPDGFLQQTLEIRERIEETIASGDPEARAEIERWAEERRGEHIRRVASLFAGLADPPAQASLDALRCELNAWRYVERLIEQLDPAYDPNNADF